MSAAWQTKPITLVCQIKPPKSEARAMHDGASLVSFVPMEDLGIGEKFVICTKSRPLDEVGGSYTYFADGDVLLAKITPCFENGKLGIAADLKNGIGFGSSEYIVFRPDASLDNEWLYYFLSRDSFREQGAARMTGAVGHKRVSKEFIESTRVPIPPLPEQQRIVGILDEAFAGIAAAKANAEQNRRNARAVFEGYLNAVFSTQHTRWEEVRISALCDIKHGYAFDGAEFSKNVQEGNPLVATPGNFTEDAKLVFDQRNTKRFRGEVPAGFTFNVGDLAVVMTDLSSKMKILGKPAFVRTENVLHNQRIGRVVFNSSRIDSQFLYYFFLTERYLKSIKASATGTMVKHTAPKRILGNVIRFPPKRQEQRSVIVKLNAVREETQHLESLYTRKLAALDELKQSLLHQAFSGAL